MGESQAEFRRRAAIERALMIVGAFGPHAMREELRRMYREDWSAWLEVLAYARECGHEILDLVCDEHQRNCACWDCVLGLHSEVVKEWAHRRASAGEGADG